jgi:hypothetical protein
VSKPNRAQELAREWLDPLPHEHSCVRNCADAIRQREREVVEEIRKDFQNQCTVNGCTPEKSVSPCYYCWTAEYIYRNWEKRDD